MICLGLSLPAEADAGRLTLRDAIRMAQAHSPEAQAAEHTYRAAYWSYRSFRANYLPEVNLVSSPYLTDRSTG